MKRKGRPPLNRNQKGVFPGNLPNVECSSTGQPPLLLRRENSLLPVRFAPHAFAVFDKDILPGIADQQLPLAGPMGADKQARNSLASEGLSNSFFEANDTERGLVSYDTSVDHDDLDKLEQNSVVKVKGRLRENIAFWRSIGASQWLLNVLCEGYCFGLAWLPVVCEKCCFPLAEARKKRKTFFSHTSGSLGASVRGV